MCKKCAKQFEIIIDEGAESSAEAGSDSLFVPIDDQTRQFGSMALKLNYLTRRQLKDAVQMQQELKGAGEDLRLDALLVRKGFLTEVQRDYITSIQEFTRIRKSDSIFAGIIRHNSFATLEQIDESFKRQKMGFNTNHIGRSIAEILTEEGAITRQQQGCAIGIQKQIQHHIEQRGPSTSIAELISKEGRITPEDLAAFEAGEDELRPPPFAITVSGDRLHALLLLDEEATERPSLDAIKGELSSRGIIYNLTPDDVIEQFLQQEQRPDETLELAAGVAPGRSEDARIECKFDVDPLKIGQMKKDMMTDFRDRGEISQVNVGDTIAIKIPAERGENGTDIFSKKIEARKPDDVKLRTGKGADLADDKKSATANLDGKPIRTPAGLVDVLPLLQIEGNIGLETGHIHFDGEIQVSGMVERGYKVTGGSLTVNELDGAIVDVRGDLNVKG